MQQWQQKLRKLMDWWDTPSGEVALRWEKQFLSTYLQDLVGYHMVLLGTEAFADITAVARMQNSIRIDPFSSLQPSLPKNLDAIIVPHMLGYCDDAAIWMESFWQALAADGQLILTGFNFFSCLGLQRLFFNRSARAIPMIVNSQHHLQMLLSKREFTVIDKYRFAAHCISNMENTVLADLDITPAYFGIFYCLVVSKQLITANSYQTEWEPPVKAGQQSLVNPYTIDK